VDQCGTLEGEKNQFGVIEKKICCPNCFLNFWVIQAAPKKHPKKNNLILITLNTFISTRKIMIYSMFISVNNMRSFVLWAVMTSFGKNNI
jgi:hypothetical protein